MHCKCTQHNQIKKCTANRRKCLQIKKTTLSIWQHTRCKCSQHNQIKKRTANTHNTTKKRNFFIWLCCEHLQCVSLLVCVVSICSTCCQIDEDVFLICWCFFYLHVFSEVAARWALSATIQNIQRKNRVSACKQKHFILASCILFLDTWMWVSFIRNKEINNIWTKSRKKTMNWIQNDNQNVDGVDQHPKASQSLLPLHWSTFYSITLHSFDAVLCQMIMLDYMWKHLLFLFHKSVVSSSLVFLEILYRRCVLAPSTI